MRKSGKIALGVFSLWPFIYMIIFMSFTFLMVFNTPDNVNQEPTFDFFKLIFGLHLFTMVEMFALIIIYVVFIFKTEKVAKDKKALWAVVIFLGNMIAIPIFWFLYIWKDPTRIENSVTQLHP
jgi:hypothetical protein